MRGLATLTRPEQRRLLAGVEKARAHAHTHARTLTNNFHAYARARAEACARVRSHIRAYMRRAHARGTADGAHARTHRLPLTAARQIRVGPGELLFREQVIRPSDPPGFTPMRAAGVYTDEGGRGLHRCTGRGSAGKYYIMLCTYHKHNESTAPVCGWGQAVIGAPAHLV